MGNGPRLTFDIESDDGIVVNDGSLSAQNLADAAQKALSNFGTPNQAFMSTGNLAMWMNAFTYHRYPQYQPTPWSSVSKLTKREHTFAALHTLLAKISALRKLQEQDHIDIKDKVVKRMRRAKWARYTHNRKK